MDKKIYQEPLLEQCLHTESEFLSGSPSGAAGELEENIINWEEW